MLTLLVRDRIIPETDAPTGRRFALFRCRVIAVTLTESDATVVSASSAFVAESYITITGTVFAGTLAGMRIAIGAAA
jgi:hypothetical protein